jgi:hypothetical protein
MKKVLFCIAISSSLNAQFQEHRVQKGQTALSLEFYAYSPRVSPNYEVVLGRNTNGFVNFQTGFRALAPGRNAQSAFSIPNIITYNYWTNRRNLKKKDPCKPKPQSYKNDTFYEVGFVQSFVLLSRNYPDISWFRIAPLLGFRVHFNKNKTYESFLKIRYTPYLNNLREPHISIVLGKVFPRFADKPLD